MFEFKYAKSLKMPKIETGYNYENPVVLMQRKAQVDFASQIEDEIVARVCQQIDVEVDKEELIKALNYDREQYEKGFVDGQRAAQKWGVWIPVTERLQGGKGMSDLISKTELKDYLKCWLAQAQYYHDDEKNDMIPLAEVMAYIKACKVQEPFINKPCLSEGACKYHTEDVLDKIKAEITEEETECPSSGDYFVGIKHGLKYACKIIDKYRTESEGKA